MDICQRALWFIESHTRSQFDLEEVASVCGVSRFHLTRAFSLQFGLPLIRYVRRRRLSEAAIELAAGATNILHIAIEFGYGSHEAFTRAFKEEFGYTPDEIRGVGTHNLVLTEALTMLSQPLPKLNPPRIQSLPEQTFVGLVQRYDCSSPAGIPNQWQRFLPYFGSIRNQLAGDAYGVCFNFDESGQFDYLTGVAVRGAEKLAEELVEMKLPAQKYVVFDHGGHVSEIRSVISAIWNGALAENNVEAVQGAMLEKYGPQFDSRTGYGGFEIWIPIK